MTGEKLYGIYVVTYMEQNTDVDRWEDLEPSDREAWDRFAAVVERMNTYPTESKP